MKSSRVLWVVGIVGLVVLGVLLLRPANTTAALKLPTTELQDMSAQTVKLSQLEGKPVVVNAWATWCAPCKREMPLLLEAAKANPEVQFVFLNIGDGPEAVKAFEAETKLSISDVYLDQEAKTTEILGIQGLPVTIFFDAKGEETNRHIGEIKADELEPLIRTLTASQ